MTEEGVSAFVRTMPPAYGAVFMPGEIEEHARICAARRRGTARAVLWRTLAGRLAVFCVVADDTPGLVARVSGAFAALRLDIQSAQIYSRRLPDARVEAVDFFWVREHRGSQALDPRNAAFCERTIEAVLNGSSELPIVGRSTARPYAPSAPTIRFEAGPPESSTWSMLVETEDCPGLLHAITRVLHEHGLVIHESDVRTELGIARDRFSIAPRNGVRFGEVLAKAVEKALVTAIQSLYGTKQESEQPSDRPRGD